MARRFDPRQASLFDVLDAVPARPVVRPVADPDWAARLLEVVAEGLPPGAPPPFREVLAIRPGKPWYGQVYAIAADVIMFDGVRHEFRVDFCADHRSYSFDLFHGMQPAGRLPYVTYYPAIRWNGRQWIRGEHSTDPNVSAWEADFSGRVRVLGGLPVAA